MYPYAYFTGILILTIPWLILFLWRRDLRKEMVLMGGLMVTYWTIPALFWANTYLSDVWVPEYLGLSGLGRVFNQIGLRIGGAEDVIFVFIVGGIAAVIYEEVLGKRYFRERRRENFLFFALFSLILLVSLSVIHFLGFINIIYGEYLSYFLGASIIWWLRKDLLFDSILSGIFLGFLYFIFWIFIFLPLFPKIVKAWRILSKGSGIFLLGVPLEEILWAFSFGLFVGPAYEFLTGIKFRN